jgi:hypothetical protein
MITTLVSSNSSCMIHNITCTVHNITCTVHNIFYFFLEDWKSQSKIEERQKMQRQRKKDKRTNDDLQNTTQKTKDPATPLNMLIKIIVDKSLIYVVCLHIVVSNTYCVVFFVLFVFVLCTLCCQFLTPTVWYFLFFYWIL